MYVPSDPHEAYKYGVNQATEPIDTHNMADVYVNEVLAETRKKLLTVKTTKWVIVRNKSVWVEEQILMGRMFDSKEAAERHIKLNVGDQALGVFPIELELPI